MPDNHILPNLHPAFVWPFLTLLSESFDFPHEQPNPHFNDKLLRQIHSLSITGYEMLLVELLRAVGYEQVQVLRDHKRQRHSHKGRNGHGGVDIIAESRSGLATDAVLVQVKQYERPVSRRFVDELRGALLRTESRHALLITTSHFSPAAVKAAQEDHIAPVHLMDSEKLCGLLIRYQIGVCSKIYKSPTHKSPRIDFVFFQYLNDKYPPSATRKRKCTPAVEAKAQSAQVQATQVNDSSQTANLARQKGGEMMGRTHALIGITALWLLELPGMITQETIAPLIFFTGIGALIPDLDAGESLIKRFSIGGIAPLAPIAVVLHRTLGHRGLLHSLAGLGLFTLLCALPLALWLGWPYGAALSMGYASHIVADSATKSGVPLLYPRRKRYHLLPKGWRLTTGSLAEETLLPFLAFAVLLLLLRHLYLVP